MITRIMPTVEIDNSGESTRLVRFGLFVGVGLVCGMLLWANIAPISGAIIAPGIVKVDSNRKTIQHLEGGIVKEILVRDGAHVSQGQSLIVLESINSKANHTILQDKLNALVIKQVRLAAEKGLAQSLQFPGKIKNHRGSKVKALVLHEHAVFESKKKNLKEQLEIINEEKNQARVEISGLLMETNAINESIGYLRKQLESSKALYEKKFIQETDVLNIKRTIAEKKERRGSAVSQIAGTKEKISSIELRALSLRNNYIQEAEDGLKDIKNEIFEIRERLRPAKSALERTTIVAPLSGQVINLKVFTVGGVIGAGHDLLDIVPDNHEHIIEAKIKTVDIDSIHLGQLADVELTAYNRRTTPLIPGEVIYISGDVMSKSDQDENYYYISHIKVDGKELEKRAGKIELFPGMPVVSFINTGSRTFMDYLLEPIVDNFRMAFRD